MAGINNGTTLRLLHYPKVLDPSLVKPGQIRCGEHTDFGSITLLFQDSVGGLEVSELDSFFSHHRSEEHTSELQSRQYLVCRLLLEKKKNKNQKKKKKKKNTSIIELD